MRQNLQDLDNSKEDIQFIDIDLDGIIDEQLEQGGRAEALDTKEEEAEHNVARTIFSYLMVVAAAAVAAVSINYFVIFNAHVPTTSMVPTVNVDDRLIGFRLAYAFSTPKRGDVIIFNHKCYDVSDEEILIKRVIGMPGDTVEVASGQLFINGEQFEENYLAEPMQGNYGPYTVPEDSYFVMGDNRNVSDDARFWDSTFVNKDEIIAKAILKYYPSIKKIK